MRSFAILAAVFAATVGTASALVDAGKVTTVSVTSAGYDERTSGSGCSPDGCIPANTRDNDLDANSRWSCQANSLDSSDADDGCWIEYSFDEPQDIVRMRIAFHKGDESETWLDVYINGDYDSTIESSGSTLGYQNTLFNTDETDTIRLQLGNFDGSDDTWLSITEVKFMVDDN